MESHSTSSIVFSCGKFCQYMVMCEKFYILLLLYCCKESSNSMLKFPKKTSLTLKGPNESSSNKCSCKPTCIDALNTEGKLSKNSLYF